MEKFIQQLISQCEIQIWIQMFWFQSMCPYIITSVILPSCWNVFFTLCFPLQISVPERPRLHAGLPSLILIHADPSLLSLFSPFLLLHSLVLVIVCRYVFPLLNLTYTFKQLFVLTKICNPMQTPQKSSEDNCLSFTNS